jgi:hypothetical protein
MISVEQEQRSRHYCAECGEYMDYYYEYSQKLGEHMKFFCEKCSTKERRRTDEVKTTD